MSLLRPLSKADIKGPALYEGMRDDFRKRIIELKKPRRISVGPIVTLTFENRHTLLFQTEEMLRAESITEADKVQDEIDVYNDLMPTADSLSATLFVELPVDADKRAELNRLIGIDEHVTLHVGEHALQAKFEDGRSDGERISAVQYIRFALPAEARKALRTEGTKMRLEITHPQYRHWTDCVDATRASLAADYAEE
ncbi:MAG: DUF3501 family protein [Deltaproteobacteria bacterium]|nr:DUF3501 family protein [Deltaproteobacteria bacterium]